MNKKIKIPVVSTTHWDREWRFSFQQTRSMLVELMDNLIDLLQKVPEYKCYHLDAQTVILEDYLAIRPEKARILKQLIKVGRILVGPWYTLPDFNVIDGESIIRNLLMGHRIAEKFGHVMKVGYCPTGFGNISQMPQIFNGFDLDVILFYRGVDRTRLKKEFLWESPDGSRLIAYTFTPEFGRMPLFHRVASKVFRSKDFYDREHKWESDEGAFRFEDRRSWKDIYFHTRPGESFNLKTLRKNLDELVKVEFKDSTMKTFLLVDGVDSTEPQPMLPKLIRQMNKASEDFIFYHASLYDFADELRRIPSESLQIYRGPMLSSAKYGVQVNLMGSAISSRIYLKQENDKNEKILIKWAEPFSVFSSWLGCQYPENYFDIAWKYLLWNQSHDSIAGCSQDIVHEDMMYYFRQSIEIADVVTEKSLQNIAANINAEKCNKKSVLLIVYNPLSFHKSEIVAVDMDMPIEADCNSIKIMDDKSKIVSVQLNKIPLDNKVLIHRAKDVPCHYKTKRFSIQFQASDIPPFGYKVFSVLPEKKKPVVLSDNSQMRLLQNEYISVKVNSDGTFDLKDKRTGHCFSRLNQFENSGEAGDAYIRKAPLNNKTVYGPKGKSQIKVQQGELTSSATVIFTMKVPAESNPKERSRQEALIEIETTATVQKGCPWLSFYTKVNNHARDHRLRVLFPSGINEDLSFSDASYDFSEHPIEPADTKGWFESGYTTYPQKTFCGVREKGKGLAVLNKGLPEYEIINDSDRTIAVTLLRCYKMVVPKLKQIDPNQDGCQCLGTQEYEYAVFPFADESNVSLLKTSTDYQLKLKVAQSARQKGKLPLSLSFLSIDFPLLITAVKKSQDRDTFIVRIYNPTDKKQESSLRFFASISDAWYLNLNEKRFKKIQFKKTRQIPITIGPYKIATVEIKLD
ncbi:MAG: hypothetical protein C0403_13130 [Desulfobacterium sp.]|nr:hypothetical protein [Desulfobacterium sp.]